MATPRLSKRSREFIAALPAKHGRQILFKILDLTSDPTPPDSISLIGVMEGLRRADCGEYRIIYREVEGVLEVPLIGKRNDDGVYRELKRRLK